MAKEIGLNFVLYVEDSVTPATFNKLKGQKSTSFDGSTNIADTTDKSNNGWRTGVATTRGGQISVEGQVDFADQAYQDLFDAWRAGNSVNAELHVNAAGDKWSGNFYIDMSQSGETEDVTTYSFTLTPSAGLTWTPAV